MNILANNWGIQMKVNPVEAGPLVRITSSVSASDIPISFLKMEIQFQKS